MRWWQRTFVVWSPVPNDGVDGNRSRAVGLTAGYMTNPRHVFIELLFFRRVLTIAVDLGPVPTTRGGLR